MKGGEAVEDFVVEKQRETNEYSLKGGHDEKSTII